MKKLLSVLLLICSLQVSAQFQQSRIIVFVPSLSELRAKQPGGDVYLILVGKSYIGDQKAGFGYIWSDTSTMAEDTVTMNYIKSDLIPSGAGRWVRTNNRKVSVTSGDLYNNNGLLQYYTTGTTDGSGNVTVNLTYENTATGTPIFSVIKYADAVAANAPTIPNDVVNATRTSSISGTVKTMTFKAVKPNIVLNAILGISISLGNANATSTPLLIRVEGQP